MMPLKLANKNEEVKILKIKGDEKIVKHLASLGITESGTITVISTAPSGIMVQVKESRLALDSQVASYIFVY